MFIYGLVDVLKAAKSGILLKFDFKNKIPLDAVYSYYLYFSGDEIAQDLGRRRIESIG